MVSEPVLWPPPPPVVAGKSFHQTLTEMRAILELHLLKHETTVYNYAKQFEEILPYALISKSRAINLFILGLQPDIRKVVQDFNPNSLDIAISRAYLHEMYGKKVNQESTNAKVDVLKRDQVASCPNDSSQKYNVTATNHAQNKELVAEARGTLKDNDKGEHEGTMNLEVQETNSQEDGIQAEEYGRLKQTESKILNNTDPKQSEDESDAVLNLTVNVVEETCEIHDLNVDEADSVAANVNLINDVIVEEGRGQRIKNWSKSQGTQDLMPTQHDSLNREGHGRLCHRTFLSFPCRRFFVPNRLLHSKGLLHFTKSSFQANQRKFVFDGSISANESPIVMRKPTRSPASWNRPGRIGCDSPHSSIRSSPQAWGNLNLADETFSTVSPRRERPELNRYAQNQPIAFVGAVALFINWRSSDDGARRRAIKRIWVACLLLLLFSPLAFCICNNKKNYIVDCGDHHRDVQFNEVEKIHRSYLRVVKRTEEEAEDSHIYSYKHSFIGLAASLTPEEASRLARIKRVVSVRESKIKKAYSLHTTRPWSFLDMKQPFNNSSSNRGDDVLSGAKYGQDVIVGILDNGVWQESKELIQFSPRGSNQKFTVLPRYWDLDLDSSPIYGFEGLWINAWQIVAEV